MSAYVTLHDTFKLFVTHIENAGDLLVVWGQRDRDDALAIEQTIYREKGAFLEGKGAVDISDVRVGQLCCAAYEDDTFYRARVIYVDAKSRKVTVLFVDYGNIETVSVSAIRSVAGVGGPVAETPQLATSYLVSRLLSNWTTQKLAVVSEHLKYCEFACSLEGNSARCPPLIKIMYMDNDFAEYIADHIGSYVPLQQFEGHVRSVFSGPPNVPAPNNPSPMWQRMMPPNSMTSNTNVPPVMNGTTPVMNYQMPPSGMPPMGSPSLGAPGSVPSHMATPMCQERVQSLSPRLPAPGLAPAPSPPAQMMGAPPGTTRQYIRMKLQPPKPAQYKSSVLEPGVKHPVLVSHVEDGPLAFSVQLLESHPQLESLMQEINSRTPEPVSGPLHAGLMCLARFMGDMSLCRALILLTIEETRTCNVYYVDYGNSDNVPYTHIFAIPPDFALPKVLSYRFALRGIDSGSCTKEEKKIFKELVQSIEAILVVAEPDGTPNKHLGDLFIDGKDVKVLLKEKLKKKTVVLRYPKVQLPREGSKDEVIISFVEESYKFFVQLSSYSDSLKNLMESVHNHCSGGSAQPLSVDEKIPGMPCCAMYADGSWYRAVILNCFGGDVVVMYVDYGNEAKVKFADLLNITSPLVSELPVQAIPCLLHEGKNLLHKLKELEGQTFTMHVMSQKDAYVSVRLFDSEGNDILGLQELVKPPQRQVSGSQNDGWPQSYNDKEKSRSFEKSQTLSLGEDSGFNEDQNWRKPGRAEYQFNNEESWKPRRPFRDDDDKGFGDNRRNGGRFSDRGYRPRGGFRGEDTDESRGFGNDNRGGFRDRSDKHRGFGDGREGFRDKGNSGSRYGDSGHKPRGHFNDNEEKPSGFGDRPKGSFGDSEGKPRGGFGDKGSRFGDNNNDSRGFGDRGSRFGDRSDKTRNFGDRDPRGGDREEGGGRFGAKGGRFGDRGGNDGGRSGGRFGGGDFSDSKSKGFSAPAATDGETWGAEAAMPAVAAPPPFPFTDLEGKSEDVGFLYGDQSKFFVHKKPENPDFAQLTKTIASTYSQENPSLGSGDVKDGVLCIAFSSEYGGWYRARVVNSIEGGAHVTFIDYGNEEDVYYDNLKTITDALKTLPPQAIPCTLRGVPAQEWSEKEIGDFATFSEAALRATFVELNIEVFSTVLINTADQSTVNEKYGATPESLLPLAATYFVPDMTVECGSSAMVEVSWFVSPSRFYVQFQSSKTDLLNLLQSIQDNFKNLKPLKTCEPGWFVLARSKDDKVVYRAQVKKADSPNKIGVEFIDYGNGELVEMSSVYSMEPDYTSLPRQAVRSKLDGVAPVGEAWPTAGTSDLDNCFMGELTCTVNRFDEHGVQVVSLTRNGVDVAAELVEKDLAVYKAPAGGEPQEIDMDLLPGQVVCGRVTYVNTEDKRLWVALEKSVSDQLQEQIKLCTAEPETLNVFEAASIANGEMGLVLTNLSKYLRAEIIDSTCASGMLVRLVDVGNCEEVAPDKIYYLPEAISRTPGQATEFVFDGSAEVGQEVTLQISSTDDGCYATPIAEDVCPLPILRRTAKVYVPYTNGISVWIHLVSLEQSLADLLNKLFKAYDGMAEDSFIPAVGSLCAANSVQDETWYRAKVTAITEEGVTVRYVDYGNSEVLPRENLRELQTDFKSHAFAREMQLTVSSAEDLSAEITELTANVALDAEFATQDGEWQLELMISGVKLSKNLIDLGKATRREDCFFPEEFTAYLTHLESLNEIYVHDEQESANVEALQAELQTLAESLEDGSQEAGSLCLALFKNDGMWYRAEILPDGRAQFIDYGNAEYVDRVKLLPEDKMQLKRFAVKCSLKAPEGREWTPEDVTRATELLDEAVTVKVLEDGDPKVVEMALGGRDLRTELVQGVTEEMPRDESGDAAVDPLPADEYPEEVNGAENEPVNVVSTNIENHTSGIAIHAQESSVGGVPEIHESSVGGVPIHEIEKAKSLEGVNDEVLLHVNGTEAPSEDFAQVNSIQDSDDPKDEGRTHTEENHVVESTHEDQLTRIETSESKEPAYEEPIVDDTEGTEAAHQELVTTVKNTQETDPAYEGPDPKVEDTDDAEPIYQDLQVEDTVDAEPVNEENVEDTNDDEPVYQELDSRIADTEDTETACEEPIPTVEDTQVMEPASDEIVTNVENVDVAEPVYQGSGTDVKDVGNASPVYEEPVTNDESDNEECNEHVHEKLDSKVEYTEDTKAAYTPDPTAEGNQNIEPTYEEPFTKVEGRDDAEFEHQGLDAKVGYTEEIETSHIVPVSTFDDIQDAKLACGEPVTEVETVQVAENVYEEPITEVEDAKDTDKVPVTKVEGTEGMEPENEEQDLEVDKTVSTKCEQQSNLVEDIEVRTKEVLRK